MASSDQDDEAGEQSPAAGPPGIVKDDIVFDEQNPYIARAVPRPRRPETYFRGEGTYPDIVEGSDSPRTGTSWGVPPVERAAEVETRRGVRIDGEGEAEAAPNRNTGARTGRDAVAGAGSWSTIDSDDTAGSPSGNS